MTLKNWDILTVTIRRTPNNIIITASNQNNQTTNWTTSWSNKPIPQNHRKYLDQHRILTIMEPLVNIFAQHSVAISKLVIKGRVFPIKKLIQVFYENKIPVFGLEYSTRPPYNGCRLPKQRRQ